MATGLVPPRQSRFERITGGRSGIVAEPTGMSRSSRLGMNTCKAVHAGRRDEVVGSPLELGYFGTR